MKYFELVNTKGEADDSTIYSLVRLFLFFYSYKMVLHLRYVDPEDRVFFNRVISVFSVVLRETTLTISVSTGEIVSMESEIVGVVSLRTTDTHPR